MASLTWLKINFLISGIKAVLTDFYTSFVAMRHPRHTNFSGKSWKMPPGDIAKRILQNEYNVRGYGHPEHHEQKAKQVTLKI